MAPQSSERCSAAGGDNNPAQTSRSVGSRVSSRTTRGIGETCGQVLGGSDGYDRHHGGRVFGNRNGSFHGAQRGASVGPDTGAGTPRLHRRASDFRAFPVFDARHPTAACAPGLTASDGRASRPVSSPPCSLNLGRMCIIISNMEYYAHACATANRTVWHSLSRHLQDTGARSAAFLERSGCAELGRIAGLLHDVGKYSREFQARLSGEVGRVDHSTAGAKVALDRYGPKLGKMLAFCIAGHHAGLANGVDGGETSALAERLKARIPEIDPVWESQIDLPEPTLPVLKLRDAEAAGFSAAFLTRMVFSALVDADYLDTEAWFADQEGTPPARGMHPTLAELSSRLDAHLDVIEARAENTGLNELRREVLHHARAKAAETPGLFSLTVPTGGGKTLTSLAFALAHALQHQKSRVIYVIPYMSIIEQTAQVFREALGTNEADPAEFVVEHHSTFDEDRIGSREAREKLRLAMENWDAPIVVTTAVQFFESLFARRPSRCRKLHNIANSVVVLDEAQTLPLAVLRPCVAAIDELARNWRTSVVLCTATQPALGEDDGFERGLPDLRELAPDPPSLYCRLKRARIHRTGELDDEALAQQLRESRQVLCIVNTRRHARELYELISATEGACHLTTLMCARHRHDRLDMVRERLRDGAPVRLVATSLVESGVDIDFPVVWRAQAGLESIIQAAGRCNRHGRAPQGDVFVFEPAKGEGRNPPPEIEQFAAVARGIMRQHGDAASLEAIKSYFEQLYWVRGDKLDAKGILRSLGERRSDLNFPFETIAKEFRLIETPMVPVIVPYGGVNGDDGTAERLLNELNFVERPGRTARRLQPYAVQIPPLARSALLSAGSVTVVREEQFGQQFIVLTNRDLYRTDVGLTWDDPSFHKVESLVF